MRLLQHDLTAMRTVAAPLARVLAHAETQGACIETPRHVREVIAESVSYAVCSRFGLDLALRSVAYVSGWGTRRVMTRRRSASTWLPFTTAPRP
jgi:hypothetical protein